MPAAAHGWAINMPTAIRALNSKYTKKYVCGRGLAANPFLVYLELRERGWLLQVSLYFC